MARKPLEKDLNTNVTKYNVGGINIDECRVGESGGTQKTNYQKHRDDAGVYQRGLNGGGVAPIDKGRFPSNIIMTYTDDTESVYADIYPEGMLDMFYCAKATNKDRNDGLDGKNPHKTVKPTELLQYLIRLVSPKGSTIIDCFMGSGSTGKAVMYENKERNANYKFIGIELNEEFLPVCKKRIDFVLNKPIQMTMFNMDGGNND